MAEMSESVYHDKPQPVTNTLVAMGKSVVKLLRPPEDVKVGVVLDLLSSQDPLQQSPQAARITQFWTQTPKL